MKKVILFAAALLISFAAANAQEQSPQDMKGERPQRQQLKPKERAKANADSLNALVQLDEKQYKKVYKIFLEEANSMSDLFPNRGGGQRPPMGGGRPGGFSGGGGRPGGFSGGGGRPPMGQGQMMGGPSGQMKSIPERINEIREKREKKLKKILTEEQYQIYDESEFKKGLMRSFGRGPRMGQAPQPAQM